MAAPEFQSLMIPAVRAIGQLTENLPEMNTKTPPKRCSRETASACRGLASPPFLRELPQAAGHPCGFVQLPGCQARNGWRRCPAGGSGGLGGNPYEDSERAVDCHQIGVAEVPKDISNAAGPGGEDLVDHDVGTLSEAVHPGGFDRDSQQWGIDLGRGQ